MILFFGSAGSGKGSQAEKLTEVLGWRWLSSGQLLRESTDPEIKALLAGGNLVPLEKFGQLFADAIRDSKDAGNVILDGFPRKLEQVEWLENHKDELGHDIQLGIVLDVPKEEVVKRMMLRARADDTPEAIEKRLSIYHEEIDPILEHLEANEVPVVHVDGVGGIDEVHERVLRAIKANNLA